MDGQGIPLVLLVQQFAQSGCVVDWVDFYETAIAHHWNPNTILARIEEALVDVHGKAYRDAVLERLRYHIVRSVETPS